MSVEEDVRARLWAMAEPDYRAFQCRLMPTVLPERVLGVRTPKVRALAAELKKSGAGDAFLGILPHRYYEENNLHAFLIEKIRSYPDALAETERFLPYVDNWATCDSFSPPVFKKHTAELREPISVWLRSRKTYTVRFGIEMLMSHYLGDAFFSDQPEAVAAAARENAGDYYVEMMAAWYFATALAKRPEDVIPFFTERRLLPSVHKKAVQKAAESFRIERELVDYLRSISLE